MEDDPDLIPLGRDIWMADGPAISFCGVPFPTRMTVIRLTNGDLFLHSPVAHSAGLQARLEALGPIRHLVSPNRIHYAHIGAWQRAVSGTVSWAAPGTRDRARSRGISVRFDRDLPDDAPAEWQGQIEQITVKGSRALIETAFFHPASRVLILTDLIENMHAEDLPWWIRPLARLAGIVAPKGRMPWDIWLTFAGNRDRLAAALGRMLAWDPETIVIAHGDIFRENAAQRLRAGFRNLTPVGEAF